MSQPSEINLDDWQQEILDYKGNVLLCSGRQVGKTTIMAIKTAKRMLEKPNQKIIIVSLTEDQAKLIIIMVLDYLEKFHKKEIAKGKNKPTQSKITLKNKSFCLARPVGTTGDAVRGFTGDVLIIDEASRMPEMIFTAAKPTLLTTAGEIWMCSTPFGKKGYFYECYIKASEETEEKARFKVWHISSEKVINERVISDSWTEKKRAEAIEYLRREKEDMSVLEYGQEYLGLFLDDLRQFFSDELIHKCMVLKRPAANNQKISEEGNYMGCDIARMGGDECAYEILNLLPNKEVMRQIENITKKRQLTTQTEEDILALNKEFNLEKIGIDAGSGSLGVGIFDRLIKNPETKRKVIAMNNREISVDREGKKTQKMMKEDFYFNLLNLMERGKILLLDDENIFISLKSVQWEVINDQFNRGTIRIFGNYTHIAEGLIRAAWLAKNEKSKNLNISYL